MNGDIEKQPKSKEEIALDIVRNLPEAMMQYKTDTSQRMKGDTKVTNLDAFNNVIAKVSILLGSRSDVAQSIDRMTEIARHLDESDVSDEDMEKLRAECTMLELLIKGSEI